MTTNRSPAVESLIEHVANNTSIANSTIALVNSLCTRVKDAVEIGAEEVLKLCDELREANADIGHAMTLNTPAETPAQTAARQAE